jgi:hypothetical protein
MEQKKFGLIKFFLYGSFSPFFVTHFLQHVPIVHGTGESPSAPFRIAASAAL